MAIIKCPECNENVSSTAEFCVHCGYRFKICPECGEVCESEAERCKSCGYPFKSEAVKQNTKEEKTEDAVTAKELFSKWSVGSLAYKIFESTMMKVLLFVIELAFMAVVIFLLFGKKHEGVFAALGTLNATIILTSIVAFAKSIFDLVSTFAGKFAFANWAKQNKYDLKEIIISSFVPDYEVLLPKDVKSIGVPHKYAIDAYSYSENPQVKNGCILLSALQAVLHLIAAIVGAIASITVIERIFWLPGSNLIDNLFDSLDLGVIIMLIVYAGAKIGIYFAEKAKEEKREGGIYLWFKENAPDLTATYSKYIRDSVKYCETAEIQRANRSV